MHWAEKIAEEVIKRNPNKPEYVCAAGISPSGSVHIGNFRDVATSFYVVKALQKMGKKAKLLFSWDEFDRLRKVPSNIAKITTNFEQYLGMPYALIPDPYGKCSSYAEYNELEFEKSLKELAIDVDYKYQAKNYMSGMYVDGIINAIKKRKEIYDVLMKYKTQESDEGERKNYYPLNVYCSQCKKDTTKVISCSDDGEELTYVCKCGATHTVKVREYNMIKLVWKVDWPMRWGFEGVDFEPGGIDHASQGGSYVVASDIARTVLGIEPPLFQGYGWLSIAGLGDMHSSTGNNITPATVLKVYEPDMIRWLFAKYEPKAAFSFNFDDTIIRHYSEFDKGYEAYKKGETDEFNTAVYDFSLIDGKNTVSKVPFGVLSSVATIVDFNPVAVKEILKKVGVEFTKQDESRLQRVKDWIIDHQPNKLYKLLKAKNVEFYATLTEEEKDAVKKLYNYVNENDVINEKDVQQYLYTVINDETLTKKENMARQQRFFKVFYNLLFGLDMGPRLYLFLAAIDKNEYLELLNF